jgi:hypothetical protein
MPQQLVYERRVFRRPPANRVAEPDNGVDMATGNTPPTLIARTPWLFRVSSLIDWSRP